MVHKYEIRVPVGIVGARGYAGLELARILMKHPCARLARCFANDSAFSLRDHLPEPAASSVEVLPASELTGCLGDFKVVFLATPAEVSLKLAPTLLEAGVRVIDLSGAFRLKTDFKKWYGLEHTAHALLEEAQYGLVPWSGPLAARLIANPGCYATAILMALLPLLKERLLTEQTLVIDAKSGASGAGRKAAENLLFNEVDGECRPYRVGRHQHLPEIRDYAHAFGGLEIDPQFTTHLIPARRGIIAGIYARIRDGVTASDISHAYANAYEGYPLARCEELEESRPHALALRQVVGSGRVHIRHRLEGDKLYVFSLIDNLLKGAASQAVENLNRALDLPVGTALTEMEGTL